MSQQRPELGGAVPPPDRDQLAAEYFEQLPFAPYPIQEEALLAWFTAEQGVLVCAPTGTGKTLIAEAAVYEALRTGQRCYYTTPLIALTDQKLTELQASAERWGYSPSQIGLVTGNRRVNPQAPVLVVVAEILLNRLLHPEAFDMGDCGAVVMDEFHSFNDSERGIVWELTLGLLPPHVRTLLLSATVGNSVEFCSWLQRSHQRRLQLVQGTERKVPLAFRWVEDAYLDEHLEKMFEGDEVSRRTPALVFCFNRDACWQTAELLKGKRLIDKGRQAELARRLEAIDFSQGAGPKLKQILMRGVGVHHAGLLPKYRRVVETLFQEKLLTVAVCTETLSAGINLPARSVVLPTILKGPKDKRRLIEPSTAHQIFGRAGRPQFDSEGFVYALAHEDDVKLLRWREKYDSIPEDTKDPGLLRAKKQLKKKMPRRNPEETYWSEQQFEKLRQAPSASLASRGQLPWRLLAYCLLRDPNVQPLRDLVGRRLLDSGQIGHAQRELNSMLITLWRAGCLDLEPRPRPRQTGSAGATGKPGLPGAPAVPAAGGLFAAAGWTQQPLLAGPTDDGGGGTAASSAAGAGSDSGGPSGGGSGSEGGVRWELEEYRPELARPTDRMDLLVRLRSINPLLGVFMAGHLAAADQTERLLALESVLEIPGNVARLVRVPPPEELPPGPLATGRLDPLLLQLGLASQEELYGRPPRESDSGDGESDEPGRSRRRGMFEEPPPRLLTLGDKLLRLFDHDFPQVRTGSAQNVWVAGEVLTFGGDFNKFITARGLQKQEGILFRHLLRLILLLDEMASIPPLETEPEDWEDPLDALIERLTATCRAVDPESTDEALQASLGGDELQLGMPSGRRGVR
jgi:superfamily II DNA/RNA helicase